MPWPHGYYIAINLYTNISILHCSLNLLINRLLDGLMPWLTGCLITWYIGLLASIFIGFKLAWYLELLVNGSIYRPGLSTTKPAEKSGRQFVARGCRMLPHLRQKMQLAYHLKNWNLGKLKSGNIDSLKPWASRYMGLLVTWSIETLLAWSIGILKNW